MGGKGTAVRNCSSPLVHRAVVPNLPPPVRPQCFHCLSSALTGSFFCSSELRARREAESLSMLGSEAPPPGAVCKKQTAVREAEPGGRSYG